MKIDLAFWLIMALSASVIGNIVALYYVRVLLTKLFDVGENLVDLVDMITSYRNHLKSVYEMEMFYGDETLQFLLQHTNSLSTMLESFEEIGDIVSPLVLEEGEGEQQEEKNNNAEKTITEQDVFYGGTRTSNS